MKTLTLLFLFLSIPFLAVGQCKITLGGFGFGEITREDVEKIIENSQLIFEDSSCNQYKIVSFVLSYYSPSFNYPYKFRIMGDRLDKTTIADVFGDIKHGDYLMIKSIMGKAHDGTLWYQRDIGSLFFRFVDPLSSDTILPIPDRGKVPEEEGKLTDIFFLNDGKKLKGGNDLLLIWKDQRFRMKVNLEYSCDNGGNWVLIESNSGYDYTYWRVPNKKSRNCRFRVTDVNDTGNYVISKESFSISRRLFGGIRNDFIYSFIEFPNYVDVHCSCEKLIIDIWNRKIRKAEIIYSSYQTGDFIILDTVKVNRKDTFDYSVFLKLPDENSYKSRLWTRSVPHGVLGTGPHDFVVKTPEHRILFPRKGSLAIAGFNYALLYQIKPWTNVNFYYSTDNKATWHEIEMTEREKRFHMFFWQVPDVTSDDCFIKMVVTNNPDAYFLSDKFSIVKMEEEE